MPMTWVKAAFVGIFFFFFAAVSTVFSPHLHQAA
jgi:hypothetical protein